MRGANPRPHILTRLRILRRRGRKIRAGKCVIMSQSENEVGGTAK